MLIERVLYRSNIFYSRNLEIDRIFLVGPSSKINAMHNDPI